MKRKSKNKGKMMLILLLVFGISMFATIKVGQYINNQRLEKIRLEEEARLAEQRRIEEEERKRLEEEERKRKAEEEARLAALAAKRYYSRKDTKMYSDEALEQRLEATLPFQTEVTVEEEIKNEAGEIIAYKAINPLDSANGLVYIAPRNLKKEKKEWIEKLYDNTDYEVYENFEYPENPPIKVKGVYVTQAAATNASGLLDNVIDLAKTTEINSFVIDVKDDNDNLLFYSKTAEKYMPDANNSVAIKDIKPFIQRLKDEGIYLIARVVVFKSPKYAKVHQDKSLHYKDDGRIYADRDKIYWASPYNEDLWEYVVGISEEAADLGFNEIQFDYVRFPATTSKTDAQLVFYNQNGRNKVQCIQEFLKFAHERLQKKKVYMTADVFGWIATSFDDQNIGQHWEAMSSVVDYMAPMVYPSHYGENNFGFQYPDKHPYGVVKASVQDAIDRNKNIDSPAILRPWIQDFTASYLGAGKYIKYGPQELKDQVRALNELGIEEFMLWNAANRYTKDGLKSE